jgi:hypothetical protein
VKKPLARRALLTGAVAGAAGVLVAACTPLTGSDDAAVPPADTDPLEPLLAAELALVASYDAVIAAKPAQAARLKPLRADHAAHAQALKARLDPRRSNAVAAATTVQVSTVTALADAEQAAMDGATAACLAATGERAALLASIAACEASHLAVLS